MSNAQPVKCPICLWRGKRVWRDCGCDYEYCYHTGFGDCPKCGPGYPIRSLAELARIKASVEYEIKMSSEYENGLGYMQNKGAS